MTRRTASFSILGYRDFRLLLIARVLATMSLQAQAVIVGWQIYSLTRDPLMLGLIGLVEAVPALCGALFAGHIVDVSRPQRVYLLCLLALSLNALFLFCVAGESVVMPIGSLVLWLFVGVFFSGLARCFIMPSTYALFPRLVGASDIPAGSAWLSGGFQFATVTGPATAGLIYGGYGATLAWSFPLLLMVSSFVLILAMSNTARGYRSLHPRDAMLTSITAGWRFILKTPIVLSVMVLDMFAVLFGGAVAMLPAYADQILGVGSEGLGVLRASPAIGAIVVALFLALYPMRVIEGRVLLLVVAGFGACMIGFGLSTVFWLSLVFLALSGAFDSVSMVIRQSLIQLLTPEAMRGRVSSVNSMFVISSNEIGAFQSGVAASLLGLVPSVVFGGAMSLLVVGVMSVVSPSLRRARVKGGA